MLQLTNIPKTNRKKNNIPKPHISFHLTFHPRPRSNHPRSTADSTVGENAMRRHGVAGGGDEGVALQDLAIEGAESSLDSEDPSGKKRDWNHGLSMGYPIFHAYSHEYSYSIHIPFILICPGNLID